MKTVWVILLMAISSFNCYAQKKSSSQPSTKTAKSSITPAGPSGKILIMSDIHFYPFYDPNSVPGLVQLDYTKWQNVFESSLSNTYGLYRFDTYYGLLKSALQAMYSQNKQPDMIIINGDFLCHNFGNIYAMSSGIPSQDSIKSFMRKTTSFVLLFIREYFPKTPVFVVLGENDNDGSDFQIQPSGPFLNFFAVQSQPMLQGLQRPDFMETFSKGGYYEVSMPWDTSQVFIGLNSVFFSPAYKNTGNPQDPIDPGQQELEWLRSTLNRCAATNKKVWLSYHIPPGIDLYSLTHPKSSVNTGPTGMWKQSYTDSFISLISQFKGIIKANFAGHTHMDEFRLLGNDSAAASFIHITPSISPILGNTPSFQEVTWDTKKMQLINCVTYRFKGFDSHSDNAWPAEYNYAKTYGISAIDANGLNAAWKHISKDTAVRNKYLKYYFVDNPDKSILAWQSYLCGIKYLMPQGFSSCISK